MKKTGTVAETPYPTSEVREICPDTREHASRDPILCKGINCGVEFLPKRKDQVFCSSDCRSEYFKVARGIGVILLTQSQHDTRMKVIVDGLLDALKNPL